MHGANTDREARPPAAGGRSRRAATLRTLLFWAAHLALAATVGLLLAGRLREAAAARALPPLRPEPLEVRPQRDDPTVVDDASLVRVLARLGLDFRGAQTRIGLVDHGLRLWGGDATPPGEEAMTGDEMLRLVTDHRRFVEVYGRGTKSLLVGLPGGGIRVRTLDGPASSNHFDHTMATLAELGTPLDFELVTPSGPSTYRELVEQSMRDFTLNQLEYEWSALTFALVVRPVDAWRSTEGQEITFGRLADRAMREALPVGVCSANHRMYSLAVMLRVDEMVGREERAALFEPEERRRVVEYLRGITDTLIRHQHPDGFWNGNWPSAVPASATPTGAERDSLDDRIIVTGHVLEWWALAPEEVQPPREVVRAAAAWLVETIDSLTPAEVQGRYTFLTHAGRALALWRGRLAHEVELEVG